MDRQTINPWTWQDAFGFVQANKLSNVANVLVCSGQTSVDSEGHPMHPGDMKAQIGQALDNLETVLAGGGMKLSDVVRLNYYTTDVDGFMAAAETMGQRLTQGQCRPASTLLGVTRLFVPEILVEIEAIAVS